MAEPRRGWEDWDPDGRYYAGCLKCGLDYDAIGPFRPVILYDGKPCEDHFFKPMLRYVYYGGPSVFELMLGETHASAGR